MTTLIQEVLMVETVTGNLHQVKDYPEGLKKRIEDGMMMDSFWVRAEDGSIIQLRNIVRVFNSYTHAHTG